MAGGISLPRFVGCLVFLVIKFWTYVSISLHMFIRPLKKLCAGAAPHLWARPMLITLCLFAVIWRRLR